jgi:hypothetical protein
MNTAEGLSAVVVELMKQIEVLQASVDNASGSGESTLAVMEPKRAGRPPHFSTVGEMEDAIERYFNEADEKKWPYTIPDLAYALGFNSRQSLLNYQNKPIFMDTIKRAKLRIEGQRARQLVQGQGIVAGQIFDLKNNFGWRDQQEPAEVKKEKVLVQNNIGLVGMPPQPRDINEWSKWYQELMGDGAKSQQVENAVDFLNLGGAGETQHEGDVEVLPEVLHKG